MHHYRWLAAVLALVAAGCNRRALTRDDAGGVGQVKIDAAADQGVDDATTTTEAGRDAIANDDGGTDGRAIPCGSATCTGTDLCVGYSGCGGPLNCQDLPDSGHCPPGSTSSLRCPSDTGQGGCLIDCPPPTFECVPRPATCTTAVTCSCLGTFSFCKFGMCVRVQDRLVGCGSE